MEVIDLSCNDISNYVLNKIKSQGIKVLNMNWSDIDDFMLGKVDFNTLMLMFLLDN